MTKNYLKNPNVFADVFNYLIYKGKKVIKPEKLVELDTTAIAIPYKESEQKIKSQTIQRVRDVFKVVKRDENCIYLLLGIENQSEQHYAMPVRNMLYDVLTYNSQIESLAKATKGTKNCKNQGEYLSRFGNNDKLIPVITLVVYWGNEEWLAPKSLYDMMDIKDKSVLGFCSNYVINLIEPNKMNESDFKKFKTDFGKALCYISNMKNKENLAKIMADKYFRFVDKDTMLLLNGFMNLKTKYSSKKEKYDMCQAIDEMIKDKTREYKKEIENAKKETELAKKENQNIAIISSIEAYRDVGITEDKILAKIKDKFSLTTKMAKEMMLKAA